MKKEQIVHYYDACEIDYRLFWDLARSRAMHAGYWDEQTKTLRQALKRENEILAEMAGIQGHEKVLDAGCGVGGSAVFLAQKYGCHVTGITLSTKQVQAAEQNARQTNVEHLTNFKVMDFTQTEFNAGSFDVVWAIESVCHAADKNLFIKEAARLLKPNGKLVMADGFANKVTNSSEDLAKMKCWLKGWGVESLESPKAFEDSLKSYGFQKIKFSNVTQNVLPSSRRLYWLSWWAVPFSRMGECLGLRSSVQTANLYSARCQYQTLMKGLWCYGIFFAQKE